MIKLFESFSEIRDICDKYGIRDYTINSDGSIDVDGNVCLYEKELTQLPLKFNYVTDRFYCQFNKLTSLEGAPVKVGGHFYCDHNYLTSLEGVPAEVGGHFYCQSNLLKTLKGVPRKISGIFDCQYNKIWTFEGAPDYANDFYCSYNPIYHIWKLFFDYSKIELFNYYDIIREVDGKPAVIMERLNDFLEEIGKKPVIRVCGYLNI